MEHPLIHDRGRGPELVGTRVTIYALVPYFLKSEWTETAIAEANRVTVEQVAAMRAYFLNRFADVMEHHEKIEERFRKGMEEQATPEFRARFWWNRKRLELFRDWLGERRLIGGAESDDMKSLLAQFQVWHDSQTTVGVSA